MCAFLFADWIKRKKKVVSVLNNCSLITTGTIFKRTLNLSIMIGTFLDLKTHLKKPRISPEVSQTDVTVVHKSTVKEKK